MGGPFSGGWVVLAGDPATYILHYKSKTSLSKEEPAWKSHVMLAGEPAAILQEIDPMVVENDILSG